MGGPDYDRKGLTKRKAKKQRKPKLVKCEGPYCTAMVNEGVVYCEDCKKSNREWEAKQP